MIWRLAGQFIIMGLFLFLSQFLIQLISLRFLNTPANLISLENQNGSIPTLDLASFIGNGLALILSIWLSAWILDRRRFQDYGFKVDRDWWIDFTFGLSLGAMLMLAVFAVELSAGWIRIQSFFYKQNQFHSFLGAVSIPLVIFIVVAFYEELFSRGYQLTNLAEGLSSKKVRPQVAILLACFISSGFFGLLHAANPNSTLLSTVNIALAGVFLATGYLLTGQLAISIGLHISWNFFQGNIFGFPVSGGGFRYASLIQIQQGGPTFLTGGNFGPEGGLLGTIMNFLGILLIIYWVKHRTGSAKLNISISEPPALHSSRSQKNNGPSSSKISISGINNIQHLIWDWNGTLLDDVDLCLSTINGLLQERGLPSVTRGHYLDVFGFPVRDYYQKIGFDFSKEAFETVSTTFITAYEAGRPNCQLMEGAKEILTKIKDYGISQSILSASKKNYLELAVVEYDLQDYFSSIHGLDNHHAAGKHNLAKAYLAESNLNPQSILLVGDTLHDAEIARDLGMYCCLIPRGHQSVTRLGAAGVLLFDSLFHLGDAIQSHT
ncbi:MAG: HAD hydrolase-like protein [Anaerolineales bacterium]|nr:HAD hydrolase-like protein [Anaerolineales bacterium]